MGEAARERVADAELGSRRRPAHRIVSLPGIELLVDRDGHHIDAGAAARASRCAPGPSRTRRIRGLGVPAARLAVSVHAVTLDAALDDRAVPVAVVVDDPATAPAHVRERARVLVTRQSSRDLDPATTLAIPSELIDVDAHPPLSPFVRARWRERLGLPANLVVRVGYHDPWPGDDASIAAALAVCSAAAVRGPWTLTALALGTAVVTDASEAERLGARDGVELLVDDARQCADPSRRGGRPTGPRRPGSATARRRLVEQQHSWSSARRDAARSARPRAAACPPPYRSRDSKPGSTSSAPRPTLPSRSARCTARHRRRRRTDLVTLTGRRR